MTLLPLVCYNYCCSKWIKMNKRKKNISPKPTILITSSSDLLPRHEIWRYQCESKCTSEHIQEAHQRWLEEQVLECFMNVNGFCYLIYFKSLLHTENCTFLTIHSGRFKNKKMKEIPEKRGKSFMKQIPGRILVWVTQFPLTVQIVLVKSTQGGRSSV